MTQLGPMRVSPETFAGNKRRRHAFPIGFAKLWEREAGAVGGHLPAIWE